MGVRKSRLHNLIHIYIRKSDSPYDCTVHESDTLRHVLLNSIFMCMFEQNRKRALIVL